MKRLFRIACFMRNAGREVREELQAHLELKVEELMSQGMSEAEAWEEAQRSFGDLERIRAASERYASARTRRQRAGARLDSVAQDLRFATRTLLRAPVLTLLTILILALGIGANTAIFSTLKAVFLQPLPLPQPEELVFLVLRRALALLAGGLVLGLGAVWASTRIIRGILFGVRPLDPTTILAGVALLVLVGVGAALLPGLRGTRLSPVMALRAE
jgi:hypothetical protein